MADATETIKVLFTERTGLLRPARTVTISGDREPAGGGIP
jgi:hypothetical protein